MKDSLLEDMGVKVMTGYGVPSLLPCGWDIKFVLDIPFDKESPRLRGPKGSQMSTRREYGAMRE